MNGKALLTVTMSLVSLAALGGTSFARTELGAQVCSLGSAGVGQPGTIVCKAVLGGATTQSVPVGPTATASGGTGGTFSRHDHEVLVTNQLADAVLFHEVGGRLRFPVTLHTGGESSLSGALSDDGAYVLTGTRLLFYRNGQTVPTSSQHLLVGDGSAAQVTLAGGTAYVSEKTGSLEAFALGRDGNLRGAAAPVAGIPAGAIVGITGLHGLVVAPVAHLATNANQSTVPVASGTELVQNVPTKEVAACWAADEDDEVCITNPGSMTISCGRFGDGGFKSYTSAAASLVGESVLDLDMRDELVGVLGMHGGVPVLMTYARSEENGDFLTSLGETALGTAAATGALLLPPAR